MKTASFIVVSLLATNAFAAAPEAPAASLCNSFEKPVFSCTTVNNKTLSFCASKTLSPKDGYVQYRYGDIGAKKVEFEFPAKRGKSKTQFTYGHYFRAQVDESHIRFENEGHRYDIFSIYNGEEEPKVDKSGVMVDDGKEILCKEAGKVEDWTLIDGILSCKSGEYDCP